MNKTSQIILVATLTAGALSWFAESCTSHVQAAAPSTTASTEVVDVDAASSASSSHSPMVDKSRDTLLQTMVAELLPRFHRLSFEDKATGLTVDYALFEPHRITSGKRYPMVVFMADASTAGIDVVRPVSQGYGALVWATIISQSENPCYILVPCFGGVVVNDDYSLTPEADAVLNLVKGIARDKQVDNDRIYLTGQAMGGSLAMHYVTSNPGLFAASMFVGCHWDSNTFDRLAGNKFVFVNAGTSGKSAGCMQAIKNMMGERAASAGWSAHLPQDKQNSLAGKLLERGCDINLITFDEGSVLPQNGVGSEQLYGFDYAYRLEPLRDWIFSQHR